MEWKVCKQNPDYSVSSTGLVRNNKTNYVTKGSLNDNDYLVCSLGGKNFRVHRLVAEEFLPKPSNVEKLVVNHKNKIRSDNNVSNLEWCSQSYNVAHGSASKRKIAVTIGDTTTFYESLAIAAEKLGVERTSITNCLINRKPGFVPHIRVGDNKATVKYADEQATKSVRTVKMTDSIGWFPIKSCPPYEININGVVRRAAKKPDEYYIMSTTLRSEYPTLSLRIDTENGSKQIMRALHIVVAETFIPNEDKTRTLVNHKNGNRMDYRVENLEWVTSRENAIHAVTVLKSRNTKKVVRSCVTTNHETIYGSAREACRQNGLVDGTISVWLQQNGGEYCDGKYVWKYGDLK